MSRIAPICLWKWICNSDPEACMKQTAPSGIPEEAVFFMGNAAFSDYCMKRGRMLREFSPSVPAGAE